MDGRRLGHRRYVNRRTRRYATKLAHLPFLARACGFLPRGDSRKILYSAERRIYMILKKHIGGGGGS